MSICGTIFTDGLHDDEGVELWIEIIVFFVLMSLSFGSWYISEKSIDIHSIITVKRESFYWLAILFTFSLGTAIGDFISEQCAIGYGYTLLIFVVTLTVIFAVWYLIKINDVLMFWVAYIMTRPLGAATGDLMSVT
jgi:uncharacterized membrane-anchored protein